MGHLESEKNIQAGHISREMSAAGISDEKQGSRLQTPKPETVLRSPAGTYYEGMLKDSFEKNTALWQKNLELSGQGEWAVSPGITGEAFRQELPAARDTWKAKQAESSAQEEAKKTFADADLCTVREKASMEAYFGKWKKGDPGIEGNDATDDPALMEYVDAILKTELNDAMFTDDYLSDHMAQMWEYTRKLRHLTDVKRNNPEFYSHLSGEKRAQLESRATSALQLRKLLRQHMNLHGIRIESDMKGFHVKLRSVEEDRDPRVLQSEYEGDLKKFLKDHVE